MEANKPSCAESLLKMELQKPHPFMGGLVPEFPGDLEKMDLSTSPLSCEPRQLT